MNKPKQSQISPFCFGCAQQDRLLTRFMSEKLDFLHREAFDRLPETMARSSRGGISTPADIIYNQDTTKLRGLRHHRGRRIRTACTTIASKTAA
jgi:hypothetical protein